MLGKMLYHILAGCFEPLAATTVLLGFPWSLWKLRARGQRLSIVLSWCILLFMVGWRVLYAGASKRYCYMLIFPCAIVTALALKDLMCTKHFQPWLRIVSAMFFAFLITCCIIKCFRFNPYDSSIRDGCAVIKQMARENKFPLTIVAGKEIERVRYYTRIPCLADDTEKSKLPITARISALQKKYPSAAGIIFVVLKSSVDEWKTSGTLPHGAEIIFQNYVDKKKKNYFTVVAFKNDLRSAAVAGNVPSGPGPAIFENAFEAAEAKNIKPFRDNLIKRGLTFFYTPREWPKNWIPSIPGDILFSAQSAAEFELVRGPGSSRKALRMKSRTLIGMQNMKNFDFHGAMKIRIIAEGTPASRFALTVLDINEKWQYAGVRTEKIFLIMNDRKEHFDCFVPASSNRFRFAIKLLHGEIIIHDIKIFPAAVESVKRQ